MFLRGVHVPCDWYYEDGAVSYELSDRIEDYFMLKNIYAQASQHVKAALYEKLERGFVCSGRSECDAA